MNYSEKQTTRIAAADEKQTLLLKNTIQQSGLSESDARAFSVVRGIARNHAT